MLVDGPFHKENVCIPGPHPGEPAPNIRATWPPLLTPQQILDEPSRPCCNGSACAARALPTEHLERAARRSAPSSGSGPSPLWDRGSGPQLPAPQFPCMWNTGKGGGTRRHPPTSCVVLRICSASLSLVLICKGSAVGLAQAGTWARGGPQLASLPPETPPCSSLGSLVGLALSPV